MIDTFDPNEVVVSVGGSLLGGFAPRMIRVARSTSTIRDERGVEGEIIRWLSDDRRGEIVVTLLGTSVSNLTLSALQNADELTGASVIPVIIKDTASNAVELVIASLAWIVGPAVISYSNGIELREWTLRSASIRVLQGRN